MTYQSALTADEASEAAYIKQHGENLAATIADTWLDSWSFLENKNYLRDALIALLTRELSTLETAQGASLAVGGPDYETWLE